MASDKQRGTAFPEAHWEGVWKRHDPEDTSWFQPEPIASLALIDRAGIDSAAPVIDVGGGASTLVDFLLRRGHTDLTVLDISANALRITRERLGEPRGRVQWVESDVLSFEPERAYTLWHDRALFHFMTGARQRSAYLDVMNRAVAPGGWVILATFAVEGPEQCSGLPVRRYDADRLAETVGPGYVIVTEHHEAHLTPAGAQQDFAYFLLKRE